MGCNLCDDCSECTCGYDIECGAWSEYHSASERRSRFDDFCDWISECDDEEPFYDEDDDEGIFNDDDGIDGVVVNNVIGTYLHGPALGKNPELADVLIAKALERRVGHEVALPALDDAVEIAANEYMVKRLK